MEQEKIKILVVEPNQEPYVAEVVNDFKAMQEIVGGGIEYVELDNDECHIYCNGEGKLLALKGNRQLDNGDILCGTFFICGDGGEGNDCSLTDEQVEKYMERFGEPEFYSDRQAHQFTVGISSASSVEQLMRMMGMHTGHQDNQEDFER